MVNQLALLSFLVSSELDLDMPDAADARSLARPAQISKQQDW